MRTLVVLLLACLVVGCATTSVETRKRERAGAYTALTAEQKGLVDEGKIAVGMPADAVYVAWGAPSEVLESETPQGHTTVWIYHGQWVEEQRYWYGRHLESDYYPRRYAQGEVIFQNDTVISWRTLPKPLP